MASWTRKYLAVPYKEMNCSSFVEHVLRDHFKRDYKFPQSEGTLFNQSAQIKESIPKFAVKTLDPKDGDLVLMHGLRMMCHVGVYVQVNNVPYVLHCEARYSCSALHKFSEVRQYGFSVEGVYSWLE